MISIFSGNKNMIDVTIITTLDFIFRPIDLLYKSFIFFKRLKNINIKIIIGHANRNTIFDYILTHIYTKKFKNISVCSISYKEKIVKNSLLRNTAIKNINTQFIVFSDIDIFFQEEILNKMIAETIMNGYSIIPCLYLNKKGTKYIIKTKNINNIVNKWLSIDFNYVKHIAIPSSFICITKETLKKIYGFDERFEGHGYEDFDFILRVVLCFDKKTIKLYQFEDKTYKSPLLMRGFRCLLASYCLKNVLQKNFVLHLEHKKNKIAYKKDRERNALLFKEKFRFYFSNRSYNIIIPNLIVLFYRTCYNMHINPDTFTVLFFYKKLL